MEHERLKNAVLGSLKLSTEGHHQEALRLMDDVIAEAIREGEELWVFTLIDHTEILSVRAGQPDRSLLKRFYQQYLTYRPQNPRALYALADVAMKEGETDMAKEYARRCHQALVQTKDEIARKDLLDLVLDRWPELSK